MNPRISVITTVYDRVECLRRCLRAMQHSVFRDFEHIVVSDNPEPSVLAQIADVCAAFGARHLNLPERTQDWGLSPAEAGLRASVGEFVCFLSDDNAYLPDHFPPLVAALDADPGLGFAYSSALYAGTRELRYPPVGAGIDLGQPLWRRSVIREHLHDTLPCRGVFSWDWEMIRILIHDKGVRWQHIDQTSFVFRLDVYPGIVRALA